MAFQQAQADGVCLRYPETLGSFPNITHDMAIQFLGRSMQIAQNTPFQWSYIDRPADGQIFLIFIPPQFGLPNDGIRWPEPEQKYTIPVGNGRELEVAEAKFGWVPQQEPMASRVRRRYRFVRGGHPQLILIHYSRGPSANVNPALNQPVRSYPLRAYNEPAVFVLGDRSGQKVFPPGVPPERSASMAPGMPMGFGGNPQAMLAQQNGSMEALERRGGRDRDRSASLANRGGPPQGRPAAEEEEEPDEGDTISVKTLAMARYRRNHEFMNEVFIHAAFGKQLEQRPTPPGYTIFKPDDVTSKISKLEKEVAELQAKAVSRQLEREARERASADTFTGDAMVIG